LRAAFASRGITQLYTHQAEAFAHIASGRQVVVTTPTASGKTLCYNLPVLDRILKNPATRALYLFPTKALAQDQMAELHELTAALKGLDGQVGGDGIGVHTYDGDTPQDARRTIRTRAHIVLSNPDMVHSGILPHHPRWAKLFENLEFVVIDELHAYRGVFGSHLTNVLRRLQRICRHYGSNPQFICSSATIANPAELAERLAEKPFSLVNTSGAPRGEKFFVFVNPPVVNRELGIRRSYIAESRRVAGEFFPQHPRVEHLAHQAHPRVAVQLAAVGRDDPGRLLPPVLLREQPLVHNLRRLRAAPHPEEAALLLLLVLFEQRERYGQGELPLRSSVYRRSSTLSALRWLLPAASR
jgi:DEAD/DEAH box helicase domain-containing protein